MRQAFLFPFTCSCLACPAPACAPSFCYLLLFIQPAMFAHTFFCFVNLVCFFLPCCRMFFFCSFVLFSLPVAACASFVLLFATVVFSVPRSRTHFCCLVKLVCLLLGPLTQALTVLVYLFLSRLPAAAGAPLVCCLLLVDSACFVSAGVCFVLVNMFVFPCPVAAGFLLLFICFV